MINRTMKITAIAGVVISFVVSLFVDFDNAEWMLSLYGLYPIMWLTISAFTKRYFKEPVWEASLVTTPALVGLIGCVISGNIDFLVKYVCFCITLSLLILEYRIVNKRRR